MSDRTPITNPKFVLKYKIQCVSGWFIITTFVSATKEARMSQPREDILLKQKLIPLISSYYQKAIKEGVCNIIKYEQPTTQQFVLMDKVNVLDLSLSPST